MRNNPVQRRTIIALIPFLSIVSALPAPAATVTDDYDGRHMFVHVPENMPAAGKRALVVVLHGGLGNASRIVNSQAETGMNLNAEADKNGFVVVYLNGTPVTRFLGGDKLGWNAGGGCCGVPAQKATDDVAYITRAVNYLSGKYGIDNKRIYGLGHSNGAMMTQRLMCETDLYAAAIAISGPLNIETETCPGAKGKRVLDIHGADDKNVPVTGGVGTRGPSKVSYRSEDYTQRVYTASGASFQVDILPGTDHFLGNIDAALQKSQGISLPQKAVAFFNLHGN